MQGLRAASPLRLVSVYLYHFGSVCLFSFGHEIRKSCTDRQVRLVPVNERLLGRTFILYLLHSMICA